MTQAERPAEGGRRLVDSHSGGAQRSQPNTLPDDPDGAEGRGGGEIPRQVCQGIPVPCPLQQGIYKQDAMLILGALQVKQ